MLLRPTRVAMFVLAAGLLGVSGAIADEGWKAGTARVVITPETPMWMAGYAARTGPSQGALHDLWAKALAVEDPKGLRAVLVSLDLCGIGRDLSEPIRDTIRERYKLDRRQIVLACSHTHSGPVVGDNLIRMYRIDDEQRRLIREYSAFLSKAIVDAVGKALDALEPAELAWESGRCDFAVNRRNNKEADAPALRQQLALKGPFDHDVPVLRVTNARGELKGIVCGYACHCTVLSGQQFCGDYAGFAQVDIEKAHPGATALFVAGCGADQNPIPRRTVEQAVDYGRQLAQAVDRVLAGGMRKVEGPLGAAYREIDLPFATLPTREQVEADAKASDFFIASRARALLETFEKDGKLSPSYPYPIQAWTLGDLSWIFLGGEVVVDYSLRVKASLGSSRTWVSAYCNDVMAYIPSLRVLKEGGYEGATSMIYYAQPTTWGDSVEEDIIAAINATVRESSAARAKP